MKALIELGDISNECFVIMPFSTKFDLIYEEVIRPAIEQTPLMPKRADAIYSTKRIMHDIWKCIRTARVVLAEITGRNPNVMYELGLCHALGKPVILITSSVDDVPFDLKGIRCIVYEKDNPRWGESLQRGIVETLKSVLSEPTPPHLLEEISLKGEFAKLKMTARLAEPLQQTYFQVTGQWKLEEKWTKTEPVERRTQMYLTQDVDKITGHAVTIGNPRIAADWIINQTISGIVRGKKIRLMATSFQVIKSPEGTYWNPDSWEGIVESDDLIKGSITTVDDHGIFRMTRIPGNEGSKKL